MLAPNGGIIVINSASSVSISLPIGPNDVFSIVPIGSPNLLTKSVYLKLLAVIYCKLLLPLDTLNNLLYNYHCEK